MGWRERFPGVPEEEWRDWRWQLRHSLRTPEALSRLVELTPAEARALKEPRRLLRLGITPYYASLIDPRHPFCPVRMQSIPVEGELRPGGGLRDPLGEDRDRPVRAIVHRYPDRVLLIVTDACPTYCRHCTRRRITGGAGEPFDRAAVEEGIAYVRAHREVRDVIVSGGDPLVLDDERLGWLLSGLRAVPHVELIRVATRAPVTCPMRIDDALARLLRALKPVFVVTHFNHPKECTADAQEACERLVDHGVPVENQSVLLRGVNSTARTIARLNQRLLSWRVRPYYLHQGDLAEGTGHLRTPLACGLEIVRALRGHTSGLAVPHLAIDLPGGGGKVTIQPDYQLPGEGGGGMGGEPTCGTWFVNYRGARYFYPDPPETDCACPYDEVFYAGADGRPSTELA
jgi:lysine 2,3-aminomutase